METGTITVIYVKPKLSTWAQLINDITGLFDDHHESDDKKSIIIEYNYSNKIVEITKDTKSDKLLYEFTDSFDCAIPQYIKDLTQEKTYFRKNVYDESDAKQFVECSKEFFGENIMNLTDRSIYNSIYYLLPSEQLVFGLRKLSNQNKYTFRYNTEHFSFEQIESIVKYIFFK